jgi:hypothetical protein
MALRSFRGSAAQMLLASLYIVNRAIENIAILTAHRALWDIEYFTKLKTKITKSFDENIGVDILPLVKEATAAIIVTITSSHRGLMTLKAEISDGLKHNPTHKKALLELLGIDKLKTKKMKQSVYIIILSTLKSNLTPTIKAELAAMGVNTANIDSLLAQASVLIEANTIQDKLKVNRKSTNTANIDTLNEIHEEISSICKLASTYFVGNKDLLEQFNFTKALKAQGYVPAPKKKKGEPKPTPSK